MKPSGLQIWLTDNGDGLAADRIAMCDGGSSDRLLVRGRTGGAFSTSYSFAWTPAVKALCVLACRSAAADCSSPVENARQTAMLSGQKGSLAASLDYAVSKKPNWVVELFGWDQNGSSAVSRFIRRTNPERKRGHTVTLSLNPVRLPPGSVQLYLENTPLGDPSILDQVARCIESDRPFRAREDELAASSEHACSVPSVANSASLRNSLDMMEEVRRAKSLYLGPGPESIEQTLLELYRDPRPLRAVSYFQRPAVTFRPIDLQQYIGMANVTIERSKIALERLKAKSLEMVEILQERSVWDIIRLKSDGSFRYFPPSVTAKHIEDYLDQYVHLLRTYPGMSVVLTSALVPTFVVTYDFDNGADNIERFSVYTGELSDTSPSDYYVLVSHSRHHVPAERNVVLQWALSHPLSVVDRDEVIGRFESVKEHLRAKGPLGAEEECSSDQVGDRPLRDWR